MEPTTNVPIKKRNHFNTYTNSHSNHWQSIYIIFLSAIYTNIIDTTIKLKFENLAPVYDDNIFYDQYIQDLSDMINRDKNHPSIIMDMIYFNYINGIQYDDINDSEWIATKKLYKNENGWMDGGSSYGMVINGIGAAVVGIGTRISGTNNIDIQFAKEWVGSASKTTPITVFELFTKATTVNKYLNAPMLGKEYIINNSYKWKYFTRAETHSLVLSAARGFIHLGLEPFESVCIMGFNSPEWFISDISAIFAGGLAVGLYTSNKIGQCEYIINNCNARIIVLQNNKLLNKFIKIKEDKNLNIGNVNAIIIYEEKPPNEYKNKYNDLKIMHWDEFINNYGNKNINKYNDIMKQRQSIIKPNNCCTLIYTSGTTGQPKGVMLSHDNLIWTIQSIFQSQKHISFWGINNKYESHSIISYLPLSHIAAQELDIYGPLIIAYNNGNGCIYFARNDALKGKKSLVNTLKFVQPTVFLGVPRVWEKIEENMRLIGKKGNFIVKFISKYSKALGLKGAYNKQLGGNNKIPYPFLYNIINKLIFNTIKSKLGFNRLMLAITGAAPIKKMSIEYFHSLGINLIEAYGMSETSGLITMGIEFHNKIGCCGPPLLGINLKIINKQICVKGRNVMMGYINNKEKTIETFYPKTGFLKTGDIGIIENNETNLLFITGRIKELIITTGGENIAPIPIEDYIKQICTAISNCILIGDQRKYLTVLITVKTKEGTDVLCNDACDVDLNCKNVKDVQKSNTWKQYIQNGIKMYNQNDNKCVSRAQRIQYFTIMDHEFSEEKGEVTSTLKLKRNVICQKYKHVIDSMYKQ